MVVDIGEVRKYIKPKADSTLRNMRKDDLIEYIRCLENNYNVAVSFNENQAKYIESLDVSPVVHGRWKYFHKQNIAVCTKCSFERDLATSFGKAICCPNCGATMDLEVE